MYAKHFIKMLIWLIVMAAIGVTGLVLANHYSKNPNIGGTTGLPTIPSISVKTSSNTKTTANH